MQIGSSFHRFIPSGQTLRITSVALLGWKHYWLKESCFAFDLLLVFAGFLFDFLGRNASNEDDLWSRLSHSVPSRIAQFYPVYTFHVIVCYLSFFSSPSNMEDTFWGNMLLTGMVGWGCWLLSVIFGCYLVMPLLVSPPQSGDMSAIAMLSAGCVAMVVLPRTLAAPVQGQYAWSISSNTRFHAHPDDISRELFFARRSLLHGLAHFFFGLVLARICMVLKSSTWLWKPEMPADLSENSTVEKPGTGEQDAGKHDADAWHVFGEEAMQDMLQSFSANMTHAFDLSARSNHYD
jgi:hypothetical protein